ncbi:hypothetical protein Syun_022606 [Stephania yunnanensis]|uniref:Serine aminopeptidase S33 domain-containing protein n=1 Tax=Stephania yunnanensis TaxID=152371 RepID=A0AAP0F9T7_9MAGN
MNDGVRAMNNILGPHSWPVGCQKTWGAVSDCTVSDTCGHGGSDGLHGYVHSLDDVVGDLKEFLDKVLMENPGIPCFCFGHSTGAAIILKVKFALRSA